MQIDAEDLCKRIPKFILENQKIREQCVYALTSAGSPTMLPDTKTWKALKEQNPEILHFHVAPAKWLAKKCVEWGVEGLVLTGTEGGGHQSYEKISTLAYSKKPNKLGQIFSKLRVEGLPLVNLLLLL